MRVANADKALQYLLQNLKIMQQNLAAAMRSRETNQKFGENYIMPIAEVEAPPTQNLSIIRCGVLHRPCKHKSGLH